MFEYNLPISNKKLSVKSLFFKDAMAMSRILYNDDDIGFAQFLDNFFDMHDMHILDKVFICLTARKLFIDEKVRIKGTADVDIQIQTLINRLYVRNTEKSYNLNGLTIVCDVPNKFKFEDVVVECIKSITALGNTVDFRKLNEEERNTVLSKLPPIVIKTVHTYIRETNTIYPLLEERPKLGISEISLNLLSNDPLSFVKLMFSDYSLNYYRDSIILLGQTIGVGMLEYSTLADVRFYLDELQRDSGKSEIVV